MNEPMDKQEAMDKFADILQIIEMWAIDDMNRGSVMSFGEFQETVIDNEYNNPMYAIWSYYTYLTGAEDVF